MTEDMLGRTAAEIADHVRTRKASPRELVEAHLERIEELNPRLLAFRRVRGTEAVAEAEALGARLDLEDLPLAGVPIAVKENVDVRGETVRAGCEVGRRSPSGADHPVVRRVREAGAVIVGVTTMPELGVWATTDGAWGITRNPWDPARTPGGSSGGSAAAVASGMVPLAHGNDGLGSIRIPAACCGLVGLKPGAGLVPAGVGRTSWFGMSENGPLATTVEDTALLLSVMAGRPDLARVAEPDRPLRIALSTKDPIPGIARDPEYRTAVEDTGRLLAAEGHRVAAADPPYSTRHAIPALVRWFVGTAEEAADASGVLQPRTRRHAALGRLVSRLATPSPEARDAWRRRLSAVFDRHDVLVLPALAAPPIEAAAWAERGWVANLASNARYAPFAGSWNLAGYPAAAVPAGRHSCGVPLSVQLVAPEGGEGLLLSVARQIELLRPWARHAPAA